MCQAKRGLDATKKTAVLSYVSYVQHSQLRHPPPWANFQAGLACLATGRLQTTNDTPTEGLPRAISRATIAAVCIPPLGFRLQKSSRAGCRLGVIHGGGISAKNAHIASSRQVDPIELKKKPQKLRRLYFPIRSDRIDLKWGSVSNLHGMFPLGQHPRGNQSLFGHYRLPRTRR